jgi:hypothetical protein
VNTYQNFCREAKRRIYLTEILNFLNNIIRYQNKSISFNQSIIMDHILQYEKLTEKNYSSIIATKPVSFNSFLLPLNVDDQNNELIVQIEEEEGGRELKALSISLSMYLQESVSEEERVAIQKMISFIAGQFQLFANLCQGRNYYCRKRVKQILPYRAVVNYIWEPLIDEEMRASLIKVIECVYLDMNPRTVRKVPLLIYPILGRAHNRNQ